MYNEKITDRCVRHLRENNKNARGLRRLIEPHKDVVNAAVEYLEKIQGDADYERNKCLKDSFKLESTDLDDDSEDDEWEDFGQAMCGEPQRLEKSSELNKGQAKPEELEQRSEDGEDCDTLELYSKLHVSTELEQLGSSNVDLSKMLSRLRQSDHFDKPYKVCDDNDTQSLQMLRGLFPNLSELVERIIGAAMLSEKANAPFELPALLIDGPPGIGKTLTFPLD